ncbi:hypothetical protein WOLCODRAFT_24452 [Wolfiporia cocos MD-104 SS10]|uniref:Uncharacterized protein n=1 Tax=Wolfiporia cocos (strain MD-104) TaxID=742152 RepID=A0A2H3JHL9_WOLCO|nr:hypothetical protein WOLCODRAFT_24452 [Wolfiporia cocos MD-104 SS10]
MNQVSERRHYTLCAMMTYPGIQNDQMNTRRSVFRRLKSAIVAAFAKIAHPSRLLRRSRHSHNAPFYPPAANEEEARRMLMEFLAQIAIERGEYPIDDRRHPVYPCMAVNPDAASVTESEYSLELDKTRTLCMDHPGLSSTIQFNIHPSTAQRTHA